MDKWFRWEREASVHLLFPTLEVFYPLLTGYSGIAAPTMILIFSKGVVTWCIREDEFIEYGNKLLKIYSNPKKEQKMVSDIKKSLLNLKTIEKEINGIDLKSLTNSQLIKLHKKLYSAFLNYYTMGAIGTPLSFSAEIILKKELTDEQLNFLTTPNEISYVAEADECLLKTKDINGFIKKYFWIDNNYSGTKMITSKEVKRRLNELLVKRPTIVVNITKANISKKLAGKDERLVELLKHYATYKDDRKKEILIYLHFIDNILKEIANRTGLTIEHIRASLPQEVDDILSGKLTKKELSKRLNFCVIIWEKGKNKAQVFTGKIGKVWERKTLEETNEVKEIKGRTACSGKVNGRVRILLKAKECNKLKKGEVLVTFMTSPDFMPAIRKCSAIVTNLGGVTSHAAIISRELGIPCIVGTKIATQVLRDGDLVEVDANKGVVKVLK